MGMYGVLGVHDAALVNSNDVHSIGEDYEKGYAQTIQWDMLASIEEASSRLINKAKEAISKGKFDDKKYDRDIYAFEKSCR